MSTFVVDASVAAKWFFEEVQSEEALGILDNSNELHIPDYLYIEVDSVICKRIRKRVLNNNEGNRIRTSLRRFPLQKHPFTEIQDAAFGLAVQTSQGLYDCLYLALSLMLDAVLVTADRRLFNGLQSSPYSAHVCWVSDAQP